MLSQPKNNVQCRSQAKPDEDPALTGTVYRIHARL